MRNAFLETADDLQWLRDTHLKGVTLPTHWQGFKSAVMQGNEDSPFAVNLYLQESPAITDDYFRVKFVRDGLVYCECAEYDAATDKPKGGLVKS